MLHQPYSQEVIIDEEPLLIYPLVDVLDFLVLPDQSLGLPYSRQTHGLTGAAGPAWDVVDATPDSEGFSKRYKIKTSKGWPWDISRFDSNVVLDWITEQTWTSPKDFKKHVGNYMLPNGHLTDGVAMFPRHIRGDYNEIQTPTLAPRTEFRIFLNCVWDNAHHFLGDTLQTLNGPVMIDHGGTIGMQPTLVHEYFWSGSGGVYRSKEENLYAYHYGWMRWSYSTLGINGQFTVKQISARNQLYAVPPPPVVFPCF